jgi:phosphate transport system substrate-binding protein
LKNLKMEEAVITMKGAGDMARELASTKGAIGMTTLTVVEQSKGRIRALTLNGVAPTVENVKSKAYVLARDSFLVTRSPPAPAVVRFLEFVRGAEGSRVISASGAVPVD